MTSVVLRCPLSNIRILRWLVRRRADELRSSRVASCCFLLIAPARRSFSDPTTTTPPALHRVSISSFYCKYVSLIRSRYVHDTLPRKPGSPGLEDGRGHARHANGLPRRRPQSADALPTLPHAPRPSRLHLLTHRTTFLYTALTVFSPDGHVRRFPLDRHEAISASGADVPYLVLRAVSCTPALPSMLRHHAAMSRASIWPQG